jgi:hypothetical protein
MYALTLSLALSPARTLTRAHEVVTVQRIQQTRHADIYFDCIESRQYSEESRKAFTASALLILATIAFCIVCRRSMEFMMWK